MAKEVGLVKDASENNCNVAFNREWANQYGGGLSHVRAPTPMELELRVLTFSLIVKGDRRPRRCAALLVVLRPYCMGSKD